MAKPKTKNTSASPSGLVPLSRCAAGIDIGSQFHVVAIPPSLDEMPVRTFRSFTRDIHQMAQWLKEKNVSSIAMESTGIYWIPAFEILESYGFEVLLVNARDAKNVPGRKTDVNDAQWIQQLHEYGLLRASFRPREHLASLRAYMRHRERMLEYAAAHIQHMQKAMMQMNLQLHHVLSDITGTSGMQIIRAILGGQQDPNVLATYKDKRCKSSQEEIAAALVGNYRAEHLFSLRQAVELYDIYQEKVGQCDEEIKKLMDSLRHKEAESFPQLAKHRHRTKGHNEPGFDVRSAVYSLVGVDLTQIHGLGPYSAMRLIAECGDDMNRWPTEKHFTSWLALAPGNKISGGKLLSSKTRRTTNRAATLLRISAVNVGRTETALGAFYRRLAARLGKAKAVTATARKIAVLFYRMLKEGKSYQDPGANYYDAQYQKRVLTGLKKRAQALGYELIVTLPENQVQTA